MTALRAWMKNRRWSGSRSPPLNLLGDTIDGKTITCLLGGSDFADGNGLAFAANFDASTNAPYAARVPEPGTRPGLGTRVRHQLPCMEWTQAAARVEDLPIALASGRDRIVRGRDRPERE